MQFDAAIVLAGGITDNGGLPEGVKRRVALAHKLYRAKRVTAIILAGKWSTYWEHESPPHTEAALMYMHARALGVPAKVLYKEEHSQNTVDNIFYSMKLFLEPREWRKVLIITSDYHLARSKKICQRVLGDDYKVYFMGVDQENHQGRKLRRYWKELLLLPTQWFLQHFVYRR